MFIKEFEGTSISDAMKQVKLEFGRDATILSTDEKQIPGSKERIFRIRAASSETTLKKDNSNGLLLEHIQSIDESIKTLTNKIQNVQSQMANKDLLLSNALEIKDMKKMFYDFTMSQQPKMFDDLTKPLMNLYNHFVFLDFDATYIKDLIEHLQSLPVDGPKPANYLSLDDFYQAHALKWLQEKLFVMQNFFPKKGSQKTFAIVGAHGSGKTTLAAKIAHHSKKNNLKVGFICEESQKIGSADTLRIISKILNIPLVKVSSLAEIRKTPASLQECDIIVIDTEARNSHLQAQSLEHDLKNIPANLETHLVLSLTEKSIQNEQILKYNVKISDFVSFSKVDESLTCGDIFNLTYKWSKAISFLSSGFDISNDFELASKNTLIKKLFKI